MSRKTLEDFPTFRLTRLNRGETRDGLTTFEFEGEFDRIIKPVAEITWFWLLIGEHHAVCVQWKSFGEDTRAATVVAHEKESPEMSGKTLYYLSPGWDPVNVWIVLDKQWDSNTCAFKLSTQSRKHTEQRTFPWLTVAK